MIKKHVFIGTLFSTLAFSALAETTLVTNVNGYTLSNGKLKHFHALKFTGDTIDKIYQKGESVNVGQQWHVIDAQGKAMLPGLIDAHGHILSYGKSLMSANLNGTQTLQSAVNATAAYAANNQALEWVFGRGWNQELWPSKAFPTAAALDAIFPDTPVYLSRVDGHAAWVNSKAMALAGISSETVSPNGGEIIKDASGKPTGIFIDNAMNLFDKFTKSQSKKQQELLVTKAMKELASYGITSVHDAGIDQDNLQVFQQLAKADKLPIRVNAMLNVPSDNWRNVLAKGTLKTENGMLQFNSVKIVADGALGSRGAAMIEDYSDHKGHTGLLIHDEETLDNYINDAMAYGFQVNTHAIGDNANHLVLDSYEKAIKKHHAKSLRHRIEHAQVLTLNDIARFEPLGIIASMQAIHATSDKNMAEDRLGERIQGAYAWRKLLNAGAVIAAGSDFPVESPNPFWGLHASVTRQDKSNSPANGWKPEEKMTITEAFRSFTIDAAFAGHQESMVGSLDVGKKADFILLDKDLFKVPTKNIWQIKVTETWVNGKQVFRLENN